MNSERATDQDMQELFGEGFHDAQAEAEERWGDTDAWRQSQERTKNYTKADWEEVKAESDRVHAAFTDAMDAGEPPTSTAAMDAAEQHRASMQRFYDCSYDLQRNLADMYVSDPGSSRPTTRSGPGCRTTSGTRSTPTPTATSPDHGQRCAAGAVRHTSAGQVGAVVGEQLAQHRAVAAGLVLAVAADGDVGLVRERGDQLEQVTSLRRRHLLAVVADERRPLPLGLGVERPGDQLLTGGELGQPGVVEVPPGELAPGHPARRPAHGADPQSLALFPRLAEPHDSHRHDRHHDSRRAAGGDDGALA